MQMGGLPIRVPLPAGLATAVGSLPQLSAREASQFVRDWLPRLPSAPTFDGVVDAGDHADGGSIDHEAADEAAEAAALDGLREFLTSLEGRVEPVVLSTTGPVTTDLSLLERGFDHEHAATMALVSVNRRIRRLL